jgi:hypothetical protein
MGSSDPEAAAFSSSTKVTCPTETLPSQKGKIKCISRLEAGYTARSANMIYGIFYARFLMERGMMKLSWNWIHVPYFSLC